MGRPKPEIVSTSPAEVYRAARLCRENARRLVRNARILLDNGGSDGLAYVLWSLAVEELGKGVLLERQTSAAVSDAAVVVAVSKDHDEKFVEGLRKVPVLSNLKFEMLLRVTENRRSKVAAVEDPLRLGAVLSVGPSTTGVFADGLDAQAGVDATVALRFDLLYVGWQETGKRFVRPGETIRLPELTGRWELNREDLLVALNALDEQLIDATT